MTKIGHTNEYTNICVCNHHTFENIFWWFFFCADGNPCYELMIARGCGIAINVMTALLILLMCRILITKIRLSDCAQYTPVDHHVSYHKIIGLLNLILAFVHSIGKKLALKKYNQFALNTSCFWGSTGSNITLVLQFLKIFV